MGSQDEFLDKIISSIPQFRQELSDIVDALESEILKFNPFEIISLVAMRNSLIDVENFSEPESDSFQAFIEYIESLCLIHSYKEFDSANNCKQPLELTEYLQNSIETAFIKSTFLLYFAENQQSEKNKNYYEMLRKSTLSYSLIVRNNEYLHHLIDLLDSLFLPQDDFINSILGFSYSNASEVFRAIEDILTNKLQQGLKELTEEARKLSKATKNFRHKRKIKEVLDQYPKELLESLVNERPSKTKQSIGLIFHNLFLQKAREILIFSTEDINKKVTIGTEKVRLILDLFSITFGEVDPKYYRFPSPSYPVQRYPIIHYEGDYMCNNLHNLYSSFRPRVEGVIAENDVNSWERYSRNRSSFLEEEVLTLINSSLKSVESYHSLTYEFVDEKGVQRHAELDGLIILDDSILIIEAKSGKFSQPARRGAIPSIKEDLTVLITEAQNQLIRTINYIKKQNIQHFYHKTKNS